MRNSLLMVLLFMLPVIQVSAQHIITGDYTANPSYHDYTPDTTMAVAFNTTATKSVSIDMNHDNVDDYVISVSHTNSNQWGQYTYIKVEPLNGNFVSIQRVDSCFDNHTPSIYVYRTSVIRTYDLNDTINASNNWADTAAYLTKGGWDCCFNGLGYQCSSNVLPSGFTYIGTKMYSPTDTTFGWIRLKDGQITNSASIVIDSYASRNRHTSIPSHSKPYIFVYPNPASSLLNFHFETSQTDRELRICNIVSEVVYRQLIPRGTENFTMNTENLKAGIYTYFIESHSPQMPAGKFIISR